MTDEEAQAQVSREAFDRVTKERDEAKRKAQELEARNTDAAAALADFAKIDSAYAHFASKELPNAYALAREAILNPKVKGAEPDGLPAELDGWFDHQRSIFGTPVSPVAEPEPARPVAPMSQPNPAAPGAPVGGGVPLVVGSPAYEQKFGRLSGAEQRAAVDSGAAVWPEAVKAAQATL
uniref:Uncharacterized protein n=1 Tax=viral metagenome TaxID=1070528 RepID=A0A6M3XRN2_9ZZZZ